MAPVHVLARVQELRAGAKVLDVATYAEQGAVVWFAELPEHPAVHDLRQAESDSDELLRVRRVPSVDPPEPDDELLPWITGDWRSADGRLSLSSSIQESTGDRDIPTRTRYLEDHPDITPAFDRWLQSWKRWAEQDRYDQPARRLYRTAWDAHRRATGDAEEMELRAGMGLLTVRNGDGPPTRRHRLMAPVESSMDERSGTITFSVAAERVGLELDMLDVETPRDVQQIAAIREDVREFEATQSTRWSRDRSWSGWRMRSTAGSGSMSATSRRARSAACRSRLRRR